MRKIPMRKHYLDNLRVIAILLLIPYHTFVVYNNFDGPYYLQGPPSVLGSFLMALILPWIMPLMFVIAGISARYSLSKRTNWEFIKDRIFKLLIPLLSGIILLVPIQTYVAEIFYNEYEGSYLNQYILFFTKSTDLTGYKGGFTPGHLWFILYLLLITLLSLPFIKLISKSKYHDRKINIPLPILILLFIIPAFLRFLFNIGGKSPIEYLFHFLLGYYIFSRDDIIEKLEKNRFILLTISILTILVYFIFNQKIHNCTTILFGLIYGFYSWIALLTFLGIGKKHMNYSNKFTRYLSTSSFSIYILHQHWVLIFGLFALGHIENVGLKMLFIIISSAIATLANYELFKRISIFRFLFGIRG